MTATAEPTASTAGSPAVEAVSRPVLARAEGVELLGCVHGCGYRDGASLVRRADGQMLQLGQLMYGLLECIDGERDLRQLAGAMSERLDRRVEERHVVRLAQKLAQQGLLAGTEHNAPPRRNPLLALRWKVLVTNPKWTQRLTAPFTFLLRPGLMWPIVAAFGIVFWFVLIHKGVASATAQAFHSPGLLLLVFVLAVVSAGFHELGHAAACRYGGATPGGMGMGLYLVWPAFYTDVTDTYRLPKRARLRVDLAGLYFNAVVAVITMGVWLVLHADALLLLVALQVLQMVKQLSPVIRADGYHILSDATGVPDLYSHMGPTLRRLLPGHRREPSALTGRARLLVTVWVLIVVPVLLSLMLGAILLLPRMATTAWDSGRHILAAIPNQASHTRVIDLLASVVQLLALALPVLGSVLITQKITRTTASRARAWSRDRPVRRAVLTAAVAGVAAVMAWAWWPSGQYQPVRADQHGTLISLANMVTAPAAVARPAPPVAQVHLIPGTHLAVAMIPVGGATKRHPALYLIEQGNGKPPVALLSGSSPDPADATGGTLSGAGSGASGGAAMTPTGTAGTTTAATAQTTTTTGGAAGTAASSAPSVGASGSHGASTATPIDATAFPFKLPSAPPAGGTQAEAVNTKNGSVEYDVAYSLVTVTGGAPVTQTNSAYAIAHCQGCTTVAVSVQVVLVVGESRIIAPINAAGSLNYDCPACTTTALADQLVVTLKSAPSQALVRQLDADLRQLNALPELGASGTPTAIAAEVAAVQRQIQTQLNNSGLLANPPTSTKAATTTSASPVTTTTSTTATAPAGTSTSPPSTANAPPSTSSGPSGQASSTTTSATSTTSAVSTTSTNASTTSTSSSATTTTSGG